MGEYERGDITGVKLEGVLRRGFKGSLASFSPLFWFSGPHLLFFAFALSFYKAANCNQFM